MARSKKSTQLTELELACVANYKGNQVEAAKAAGVKNAKKQASAIFNRPRVKAAVEKKISALVNASGKALATGITISRNDIINELHKIALKAKSESARVAALSQLKDIFGLSAKNDPFFAGWSKEELDEYARTGEIPASVRARIVSRAG